MAIKSNLEAQNPLILRCNRLMEAFAKSDDERDFYLDRWEGFIIYADLDKPDEELIFLEKEISKNKERYCLIPKLTFYETKKIMEGFVNEKVYDIDTKEKLLDIIQSKEARENFLEFIYDHHAELEKWQTYYQERSRIRIIEWLRNNHFHFVFEEDLEFPKSLIEKLKKELFQAKVGKDILNARKILVTKAKTYYSNEALNPRPKRGRPPKQTQKQEIEHQITTDIYTTVPNGLRGFLFIPDLTSASSSTFSSKFGTEEELLASRKLSTLTDTDINSLENINKKLATLRSLSDKWIETETSKKTSPPPIKSILEEDDFDDEDSEEEFDEVIVIDSEETSLNGFKAKPNVVKPLKAIQKKDKKSLKSPPKKKLSALKKSKSKTESPTKVKGTLSKKKEPAQKAKSKVKISASKKPKKPQGKVPLRSIVKIKNEPKKKDVKKTAPQKKSKK